MSLMDAPVFDERRARRNQSLLIGAGVLFALVVILTLLGYVLGHGWLFTNLRAEHRVGTFFDALESRDYAKAYGIYNNDDAWQAHADKYSGYPLQRFTEDWTTQSPVKAAIASHHVDISKTDGSGAFGTGVIVATRVNGEHKVFMYVNKKDGTMTWPAPHELGYNP